jgi:hypothetical protein
VVGNQVECDKHGRQPETFVCQHIFESLSTGVPVGFFYAGPDDERGDAWCAACERARAESGEDDWTDELIEALDPRPLCGACYDDAKRLAAQASTATLAGNTRPPTFAEVSNIWVFDGALRDIYVTDTNLEDWRRFIALATTFPCTYKRDGRAVQRLRLEDALSDQHDSLMRIEVGKARLHCHFFAAEEIEIDIDPREIASATEHDGVMAFVESLGQALGKPVVLTPENDPETPIVSYQPSDSTWRWRSDWLADVS